MRQFDLFPEFGKLKPAKEELNREASRQVIENVFKEDYGNAFKPVRTMETGATRSSIDGKFDYEGFLNPAVLAAFANYLHKHRVQPDGTVRDSDNWQKGISKDDYMKSALRHLMDVWAIHRGYTVYREKLPSGGEKTHYVYRNDTPNNWKVVKLHDSICGVIFNMNGYLLEDIKSIGGAYAD